MTFSHINEYKRVLGVFDCKDGIEKTWDDMIVYSMASNLQEDNRRCLLHIALVMISFMDVRNNKFDMASYFTNE